MGHGAALYGGSMTGKRKTTRSSLSPRERARLLKEAADRARAQAERPARLEANAKRLAEQRSGNSGPAQDVVRYIDPADRIQIEQRTRNAVMDGWKAAHEAQLADRD